jgi:hypothetical protein
MNMVVPAGNKKLDWSPKEVEMIKTASTEAVVVEEKDMLYEAAKKHLDSMKIAQENKAVEEKCKDCGCCKDECKCVQKKDEEVKIEVGGEKVEEVAEKSEDAAVAKIEEAVIEIEDAVEELKGDQKKEEVAEEVEIEITDDDKEVVPGKEVSDGEIIVVSEPSPTACMAGKKEEVKVASTDEEFQKFAKLSPENKKKLANYWTQMLGYPKDYVDLMTKDYEK